jgi:cytochrome oxidase Cu insertion factor (SCO1/SenC/PrrC family)
MFNQHRIIAFLLIIACGVLSIFLLPKWLSHPAAPLLQATPSTVFIGTSPAAANSTYPDPASPSTSTPTIAEPTESLSIAPDFNLPRENGNQARLSDYRGKSTVVLVFYRGQT